MQYLDNIMLDAPEKQTSISAEPYKEHTRSPKEKGYPHAPVYSEECVKDVSHVVWAV